MEEINVGLNVEFPDQEQKSHTIVMEIKSNPPAGINYGWAYPEKPGSTSLYRHPLTGRFDLLEAFDSAFLTENKWVYVLATIEFALNFRLNGMYYDRRKRIDILEKIFRKDNLKKLVFFSRAGLASLKDYAHITDKKINDKAVAVYNAVPAVDESLLKQKKDKFRILFIGTAFHLKGGAALIDAFEILQKKYPFIELEMHSSLMKEGYLNSEIYQPLDHERTVRQVKSNKSIFSYNSFDLSREEILNKVYPRADLFILPSMQEGSPYVLQEAMAYGIPVISTNCIPSIPEIVEAGENGLIIDVQNRMLDKVKSTKGRSGRKVISKEFHNYLAEQIVANVSKIIEDDSLRRRMRNNNIKKAKTLFSFRKRNRIMRGIYEEAVRGE